MTEEWDTPGHSGWAYREVRWSDPNSGGEWTREEIWDASGQSAGMPTREACSREYREYLEKARTESTTTTKPKPKPTTTKASSGTVNESVGERNARESAADYLEYSSFSRSGLIDQLEYEGFTTTQAKYGVDAQGANWNAQAALKAADYLEYSSFSRSGLIDQLEYEGFTTTQAQYGANAVGY
jgi:hypothetical protein